jgi:hypothetical protein
VGVVYPVSIRYHCDGPDCDVLMTDEQARIELSVVTAADLEPDDDEGLALAIEFGFAADHHFHASTCLAAWAMDRHLNGD